MEIRRYASTDQSALMALLKEEGKEWECYYAPDFEAKYMLALETSVTYVACEGPVLCGYSRSLNDGGFYIYVCDLLVSKAFRRRGIGRQLMECLYKEFPDQTVYVMSDVDGYYEKLGYRKEGSVFEVAGAFE